MRTLEQARRYENANPGTVKIYREVRYFACIEDGKRYSLEHDWQVESLDRKLWNELPEPTNNVCKTQDTRLDAMIVASPEPPDA